MAIWSGLGSVGGAVTATAAAGALVVGGVLGVQFLNKDAEVTDPVVETAAVPKAETPEVPETTVAVPEPETATPLAPTIDLFRADADGNIIVAGKAEPNGTVVIFMDGAEVNRAPTDGQGSYAGLFSVPLADKPRVVSMVLELPGQDPLKSKVSAIIEPRVVQIAEPVAETVAPADTTLAADTTQADAPDTVAEVTPEVEVATALIEPDPETPIASGEPAAVPEVIAALDTTPEATPPNTTPAAPEPNVDPVNESETPSEVATNPVTDVAPSDVEDSAETTDVAVAEETTPVVTQEDVPTETVAIETSDEPVETTSTDTETPAVIVATKDEPEIVATPTPEPSSEPLVNDDAPSNKIAKAIIDPIDPTPEIAEVVTAAAPEISPEPIVAETVVTDPIPASEIAEVIATTPTDTPTETVAAAPKILTDPIEESREVTVEIASLSPEITEPKVAEPEITQPNITEPEVEAPAPEAPVVTEAPVIAETTPTPEITTSNAPSEDVTEEIAVNVTDTAVEAVTEEPATPSVLLADDTGIRVVQSGGVGPQGVQSVVIDTISYDPKGEVSLGGRGSGAGFVRVYLNNKPIKTTEIGVDGQWRTPLPEVDTGVYTLRIDEVDDAGKVTSRVETPFKREEPEIVAALDTRNDAERGADVGVITVQPGNTLWGIASEKYGDGLLYVRVFDANKDRIRNPDLIYPGQLFEIPE